MSRFDKLMNKVGDDKKPESEKITTNSSKYGGKYADDNYQRTTVYLPKKLHKRLRMAAISEETEMTLIMEKALMEYLDKIGH